MKTRQTNHREECENCKGWGYYKSDTPGEYPYECEQCLGTGMEWIEVDADMIYDVEVEK